MLNMTPTPSIIGSTSESIHSSLPTLAIPIRLVFNNGESEASGSSLVTPQQKRRRPSHALPAHPHRRNRKVSAPPELQAHLGGVVPSINFPPQTKGGANPSDSAKDHGSTTEFIINLNNGNKLTIPEGLHSGSDSGVPSEYSSWAAPIGGSAIDHSSPYEDVTPRSISGSMEDLSNNTQKEAYMSDSDIEDFDASPSDLHAGGVVNRAYLNSELPQPLVLSINNTPAPLMRASTDTNLFTAPNSFQSIAHPSRPRTNSMVFQLNLANSTTVPGNNLHNSRSVSMVSLNTATNTNTSTVPINYPNLSGFNNDNQSIYGEAAPNTFRSTFLRTHLSPNMGSQGSLSGVGCAPTPPMHPNDHHEDYHHHEPQPTDPLVKKKWVIDTMSENLSTMYAIFLFMLGTVIYLADTFSGHDSALAETFNVYLILVQLMWLVYIHIDVRRYVTLISQALEEAREKDCKGDQVQLEPTLDGQYQLRINLPEPKKTFPQHYGFTSGRHGGSLYLKIGAAVFCLGYLIHTGLNLGQKILYLTSEDEVSKSCTCAQDILMSILQPIYAFYQLFFIFKYSNLIINRRKRLSRFALMHCISASLCFWVYTILQETLQAIFSKKAAYNTINGNSSAYNVVYGGSSSINSMEYDEDGSEEIDDEHKKGASYPGASSSGWSISYGCEKSTDLSKMINDTTPYLYPFSIEYNILIVGIWILLWENIGRMDRHTHLPSVEMTYEDDNTKGIASNLIIYVDCHSSNRGLFAGLLMTVATVISIILFFIFTANEDTKSHGLMVNGYSELIVLIIMIITAVFAYMAIRHLDVIKHSISNVDDILLYICLPCIFMYAVFSMVPAIKASKYLFVAVSLVQVIQAVIQTAFICDGLRRCSNSSSLATKKPGRELVTFLVVANVALWLLETFEIKSEEGNYYKYDFYGKELWTMLSHMTLPLALFYRFHSSVCLVDIWKAGYESEPEH